MKKNQHLRPLLKLNQTKPDSSRITDNPTPSYMSNTGKQPHTPRENCCHKLHVDKHACGAPLSQGETVWGANPKQPEPRTKETTLLPQKLHRGFTGIRDAPPSLSSPGETRRRSRARNTGTLPFEGGEPQPASAIIFTDMSTFLHTTSSSCLKEETNQVLNLMKS